MTNLKDIIKNKTFIMQLFLLVSLIPTFIVISYNNEDKESLFFMAALLIASAPYMMKEYLTIEPKIIFEKINKFITGWFDIIKWLSIIAAISFAAKTSNNKLLFYILDISYILIYAFLLNKIYQSPFFSKLPIESEKNRAKYFLFAIASMIMVFLLQRIISFINEIVIELMP